MKKNSSAEPVVIYVSDAKDIRTILVPVNKDRMPGSEYFDSDIIIERKTFDALGYSAWTVMSKEDPEYNQIIKRTICAMYMKNPIKPWS